MNRLEHPCDECEAPYGYKNHMSLSGDTEKFTVRIATIYNSIIVIIIIIINIVHLVEC